MYLSKTLKIAYVSVCFFVLSNVVGVAQTIKRSGIFIRDPFILPVNENKTYYMYSSKGSRDSAGKGFYGIVVYKSKDLQNWTGPFTVYQLTDSLPWWPSSKQAPWAPEVHRIQNKYYLFATFHHPHKKLTSDTAAGNMHERGTAVLIADKPEGPFRPITNTHTQTPKTWMTLDGTPFFENNKAYMVFCREWLQTGDGTIEAVEMHKDFSSLKGKPRLLFSATSAPWVKPVAKTAKGEDGYVTDGPWFYRTKNNTLLMLWSSFTEQGYAVAIARSESGKLKGPWKQEKLLYNNNGGHPMLFKTFDGRLVMALHQPNSGPDIRARLFEMNDSGNSLEIRHEIPLE